MFQFQQDCLKYYLDGKDGMLNSPTGTGKTYALALPILIKALLLKKKVRGVKLIWITPLRALSIDIANAIQEASDELGLGWRVERRSGDVDQKTKKAQFTNPPDILITTPESIHLILAAKGGHKFLKNVEALVVDEWHELLSTKRGVQVELAISRLKSQNTVLQVWGVSATIGNMDEATEVLLGKDRAIVVRSGIKKNLEVTTLLPEKIDEYPWAGHLGIKLLSMTLPVIAENKSTILFTNTRSQAEIWYQRLLDESPDLVGRIALHHGSLDQELRLWVEKALHEGKLKAVVSTSSLDLGVDFRPVSAVIQIGSPKGIARFIQRAGRSGHSPYETSKIYFLPTNSLEIIEAAALKRAVLGDYVESRIPIVRAFDVLIQYAVSLAVGDGFKPDEVYQEIVNTHCYNSVSADEWQWLVDFITRGGKSLQAYEEFNRVEEIDGLLKVTQRRIAMRHRLSMGTIVSEISMSVKLQNGKKLGNIEEYFISRLEIGDAFAFAGQVVELIRVQGFVATVRYARSKKPKIPAWTGGRISLSSEISEVLRHELQRLNDFPNETEESEKLIPLFNIQRALSAMPGKDDLLIESLVDNEGHHVFIYPFEGRMVHEGMVLLLAYRISKMSSITLSLAMNDYGMELLSDREIPFIEALEEDVFSTDNIMEDISASSNMSEMAGRRFRDIAAISGLTFKGFPGRLQKERHLQSSSRLFFEVFQDYEPDNLLLQQSYEEVLYNQLEADRIRKAFERMGMQNVLIRELDQPSPFAFPIMVDRLRDQLSTEHIEDRVVKMLQFQDKK